MSAMIFRGKATPAPEGGGIWIISKDMKIMVQAKGEPDKQGSIKIDASKKPKQIDLIGDKQKKNGKWARHL
jgi:uncharacterized protein (TIGR03067 family)